MIFQQMFRKFIIFILMSFGPLAWTQQVLDLDTFLGYVKSNHPYLKQANIKLSESEAKLLKQRGAFDPKFAFEKKGKTFKGMTYYETQNTKLTIPTLYGMSLETGVQTAAGAFLNPENQLTGELLFGVGASFELGRGLLSNPRQTALKQAKLYTQQAQEENALQINSILTAAVHSYLEWYKAFRVFAMYDQFVTNAAFRFEGVKKRMAAGDLAVIDTTEARIAYNQRLLSKENARMELRKKALKASNYLWIDEQAVVIRESFQPALDLKEFLQQFVPDSFSLEQHPKLQMLRYKKEQLKLEKRLQRNSLLPQVRFSYQWLSESEPFQNLGIAVDPDNQTAALKVALPLFLRKERATLKLASLALEDLEWEQLQARVQLQNSIQVLDIQKKRLANQNDIAQAMVSDYQLLFDGEKKKFAAGESSLFLVNARESKLIEAMLQSISLEIALQKAYINYFYSIRFPSLTEG